MIIRIRWQDFSKQPKKAPVRIISIDQFCRLLSPILGGEEAKRKLAALLLLPLLTPLNIDGHLFWLEK